MVCARVRVWGGGDSGGGGSALFLVNVPQGYFFALTLLPYSSDELAT